MRFLVNVDNQLKKWEDREKARINKAVSGSLYEAAYLLYQQARKSLKAGTLGMKERQPYRNLSSARKEIRKAGSTVKIRGGKAATVPLKSLTPGVLYKVHKAELRAEVGFIGTEAGAARLAAWAEEMAKRHAPGYTILYTEALREKLHRIGIHLKKATTQATVTGRSIVDKMHDKHSSIALEKLTDSFARKMAGERT